MTMKTPKLVTASDILDMESFGKIRKQKRAEISNKKKYRRVAVGPDATFMFENYDTMWWQIHEMLFIEKGGEDQIEDELSAYNPLIPQGSELVATLMFEIDEPERRKTLLMSLGGVEEVCCLTINGDIILGDSETDVDRTTAAGKASSVQFIHFNLSADQIELFKKPNTQISVGINHPAYGHMAIISPEVKESLVKDFE
ncbi:MAG: hypothetical protein CMM13_05925 [Rhodospirillaceae bacterium]|nr:hypothetical protein [Rhodospirillaceae bacterium]OUU56359.1 MAG: hypothetical protein CBC15_10505 [Candidatus Endolissoclinum sp. TMED55]